jgi:hypothetical protein
LEQATAPFAVAMVAQSLWCAAFRPWAANMQYLPTALLGVTGLALCKVSGMKGGEGLWAWGRDWCGLNRCTDC